MQIGIIKRAKDIGKNWDGKYIWIACPICKKERWVRVIKGIPVSSECGSCCQVGKCRVKTGIHRGKNGYVYIFLEPTSLFASMRQKKGYVLEHRLVMAKKMGRCLNGWEHVHHINEIKDDNRIENLIIVTNSQHRKIEGFLAKLWVTEHPDIVRSTIENIITGNK